MTFADSCVEMIEHCLNTPPDEHAWECEEERWHDELGERPACYMGAALDTDMAWFMAMQSWLYAMTHDLSE